MELKSSDLKIGNLLTHKDYPLLTVIVVGIEKMYIEYNFFKDHKNTLFERNINEFKPIPLSVEWLKRANYKQLKRIEKTYSLGSFEDNSSIYFTGVRFIHIQTGTHLEWVNEWQNLYSAIHKKELKFNF